MRASRFLVLSLLGLAGSAPPGGGPGAASLAVEAGAGWQEWWRADRAPVRWTTAHPELRDAVAWRPVAPGIEWGEVRLSGAETAWRVRVVLCRFDPHDVVVRLWYEPDRFERTDRWSVADAPEARVAFNAGQFDEHGPWGWFARDGRELRPPGYGPLAPAIVLDSGGRMALVPADSIAAVRRRGGVQTAFQSYPAVLVDDGAIPEALRFPDRGVSLTHRDIRLALGVLEDGRWLVALTRFEGLRGALSNLPFGLTTPEMSAFMGALGSRQAVLLDGGLSGQLSLRDTAGTLKTWDGLRRVPAGLTLAPGRAH